MFDDIPNLMSAEVVDLEGNVCTTGEITVRGGFDFSHSFAAAIENAESRGPDGPVMADRPENRTSDVTDGQSFPAGWQRKAAARQTAVHHTTRFPREAQHRTGQAVRLRKDRFGSQSLGYTVSHAATGGFFRLVDDLVSFVDHFEVYGHVAAADYLNQLDLLTELDFLRIDQIFQAA